MTLYEFKTPWRVVTGDFNSKLNAGLWRGVSVMSCKEPGCLGTDTHGWLEQSLQDPGKWLKCNQAYSDTQSSKPGVHKGPGEMVSDSLSQQQLGSSGELWVSGGGWCQTMTYFLGSLPTSHTEHYLQHSSVDVAQRFCPREEAVYNSRVLWSSPPKTDFIWNRTWGSSSL